jgi:hypothetical protein
MRGHRRLTRARRAGRQVFLMRRQPVGDYMTYIDRYDYFPMPLPSWID